MTPEQVVAAYREHLRDEAYAGAAALVSDDYLAWFREHEVPRMRPASEPTVEQYMERSPDLLRAVAEYWVARSAAHRAPGLSDYFAGVGSVAELDGMSDREIYARHLQATDHAALHRRCVDALRARHPEHEAELLAVRERLRSAWSFVVVGSIEGSSRGYVLFAWPEPDDDARRTETPPHVAVVRRTDAGWRLAANPSPYSGLGVALAPIPVRGPDGTTVLLDPSDPELHEP